jgi:RNA polymerase sigma factor (sigma-70 family)
MANLTLGRFLHLLLGARLPQGGPAGDGHLLERFAAHRDAAAFEALLQRHGPMVWGVCRRVLFDPNDVDDAFQATFLVLVRKAHAIAKRESLGSWLHGVAHRVALRARVQANQRRARERQAALAGPHEEVAPDPLWTDVRRILDEELGRLPEKYRAPLILCYLEGKTNDEAADQLGWTRGTIAGRLNRARALLRGRLSRRGIASAVGTLGSVFPAQAAPAPVPVLLARTTLQAAVTYSAGPVTASTLSPAVALAEGVLTTMRTAKLRMTVAVVMILGILGTGAGFALSHALDQVGSRPGPDVPKPAPVRFAQADEPVIVVAASYPGANAQVVADTVAAPIEQQVNGVAGMMYMVSQSSNDGSYTLTVTFKPGVNLNFAQVLVQNRVNLCLPQLPDAVKQGGVITRKKVGDNGWKGLLAEAGPNQVAFVVIDRGDQGWKELQKAANAIVKPLAAADTLRNPQVFPGDEKAVYIDIDLDRCRAYGVPVAEVFKAVQAAAAMKREELKNVYIWPPPGLDMREGLNNVLISNPRADAMKPEELHKDVPEAVAMKPEELKNAYIRSLPPRRVGLIGAATMPEGLSEVLIRELDGGARIYLRDLAAIDAVFVPAAVYRINGHPAIRITGAPPEGKSVSEAGAQCVDLAQAELKRLGSLGFAVENLSAK